MCNFIYYKCGNICIHLWVFELAQVNTTLQIPLHFLSLVQTFTIWGKQVALLIVVCSMKTLGKEGEWCLWLLSIAIIKTLRREGFISGQEPESKTCKGTTVEHCWVAWFAQPAFYTTQDQYQLRGGASWNGLCWAEPFQLCLIFKTSCRPIW